MGVLDRPVWPVMERRITGISLSYAYISSSLSLLCHTERNSDPCAKGYALPRMFLNNLLNNVTLSIWYDWHDGIPPSHFHAFFRICLLRVSLLLLLLFLFRFFPCVYFSAFLLCALLIKSLIIDKTAQMSVTTSATSVRPLHLSLPPPLITSTL
jgi:hypothetical protein